MNPNLYIAKLVKIIKSCVTLDHLITSKKCVDLFDSRELLHYSFFKENDEFPITHHQGFYDHLLAMNILAIELRNKEEWLKNTEVDRAVKDILSHANELGIESKVIKLANQMREINIHFDRLDSFEFAIKYIKEIDPEA
tara:strand:+ start:2014 stop:2430 length:417 start_codon:yes stop_codon:yes gene_type:complete